MYSSLMRSCFFFFLVIIDYMVFHYFSKFQFLLRDGEGRIDPHYVIFLSLMRKRNEVTEVAIQATKITTRKTLKRMSRKRIRITIRQKWNRHRVSVGEELWAQLNPNLNYRPHHLYPNQDTFPHNKKH